MWAGGEMGGEPVVDVKGLWTMYGDLVVHRDLDFSVMPGEVMSLVGGSGSGKTTLLRQMLGLERPHRGSIRVFGVPLHTCDAGLFKKIRKRWGVLFQQGALYSALSVFDNIALPLRELHAFDADFIRDIVMVKLGTVGIDRRHSTAMPADLSGGMIKRVALARALGLDPDRSEAFVKLVRDLHIKLNFTVVMATHDLDTLVSVSDRIAVIADQKVVVCGRLGEVVQYDHPFIRDFFLGERGRRALSAAPALQTN